jgi:hypothetical protein
MRHFRSILFWVSNLFVLWVLTACTPVAAQAPDLSTLPTPVSAMAQEVATATKTARVPTLKASPISARTLTPQFTIPAGLTPSATPDTRLSPEKWQNWPVIPTISTRAIQLYRAGLAQGNNPNAFSKIGDCQNITSHFLGEFDNPQTYKLGSTFEYLQPVINQFQGMFKRESAAVRSGYNVAAVLSPLQADPDICKAGESPVACELRINKPSIVIISLETWWAKRPAQEYEKYMRQILDLVIAQKALPILATKADNLEGDHSVNATLARLAYEYDIPLWNFWKAVQPIPNGGLSDDGFHLSHDSQRPDDPLFYQRLSDPKAWNYGWTVRNLTALQVLDAVWRQIRVP